MPQGLMIILLSFLAVPAALAMPEVGGLSGMREALGSIADTNYLSLFDKTDFKWGVVVLLCIKAPLTALALPHLISVCGAGRSEWEGRMGFTGGNLLKRICTIGWAILGLSWLAYVMSSGQPVEPDAAFGDAIRHLLPPVLQGVMLACVMGAAMSSGDAFQVTVAGLFSRNIYRPYIKPMAEDKHLVKVTKVTGIIFVVLSLIIAVLVRDIVGAIMAYFNILALVGISTAMGILWRRMNQAGVFCSVILASITFVLTRVIPGISAEAATGLPILVGVIAGIVGSLATPPPSRSRVEKFFTKIYVPVGQEEKLNQSLDEVVPEDERLCTAGGLFLVKPRLQSWLGFVIVLGICVACVAFMAFLLA
jgi:Na+/proline symporter